MKMTVGLLMLVVGLVVTFVAIVGLASGFPLVRSLTEFLVVGIFMVLGGGSIAWQAWCGDNV